MQTKELKGKKYEVDAAGYLFNYKRWDEDFAESLARACKIEAGLTKRHWRVIYSIREYFDKNHRCPLIYETCEKNGLRIEDLESLFPTGYQRGACKLAGITYRSGSVNYLWSRSLAELMEKGNINKKYDIDDRGFLLDPSQWDEEFAAAFAMGEKNMGKLTDEHWKVLYFLRDSYADTHEIPNVYETCEALLLDLEELKRLFPDGYHRGAVRLAGLRAL